VDNTNDVPFDISHLNQKEDSDLPMHSMAVSLLSATFILLSLS
jgi:hypothetical protein